MEAQAAVSPAVALLHERMEGDLKLVGLTGGIASGKSTVSEMLRDAGIPVIDADRIARDIVNPEQPAYDEIVSEFGTGILGADGAIDRERLGRIVFGDSEKRRRLEEITHPRILRAIADEVRLLRNEGRSKVIVIDAALLFESGLNENTDFNILVAAPPALQLRRLMERDEITEEEARRRIESQMPLKDKVELADAVIDNSGSVEETAAGLSEVLTAISGESLLRS